jgi:shikimate kinase
MKTSRIFLVGFMCAGKSTVGPRLAHRLGWEFIDLDQEIERAQRRSIRKIFDDEGEANFRALETAALKTLDQRVNCVVALGGGAFTQEHNRSLIHHLGVSVFLDCPLETILDRCPPDGTRPLFRNAAQIRDLYERRLPHYRQSKLRVEVSSLEPDDIVDSILGIIFAN